MHTHENNFHRVVQNVQEMVDTEVVYVTNPRVFECPLSLKPYRLNI